ncbi:IclR family transcriptional regulator [Rhodoplanes sp. TEM]|nr:MULTISPECIES: IclR family transcriptional regulator [Rhodoplanes]MDC7985551.1 IclR family transcriptional regulator [Rhodoplanes sp. TEM]MDQ0355279.1 DNA-binding IclR family transcriptional regulator [Rhodoplanes tepidamans]
MKSERCSDNRNTRRGDGGSQSAARAIAVLNLIGRTPEDLGVREIARRLALPSSVVQRLINTLAEHGFLEQSPNDQKYRIGFSAFQVGQRYLARNGLQEASLPVLRELAERDQVNAFLGVLRDRRVVYLAAIQSSGPITINSVPGSTAHLHSTAFGKALLAETSDEEVARLLGEEPYVALTANTRTTLAALRPDLAEVRRRGYAVCDEENLVDVYSVGAVVRDAGGRAVAAISGAVPRHRLAPADMERLCRLVSAAAERIARRLGAGAGGTRPDAARPRQSETSC